MKTIQYLLPVVGLLAFLWICVAALYPRPSLRRWQQKAQMLLGLSGMLFLGLRLYEVARSARSDEAGSLVLAQELRLARVFMAGVTLGVFVTLWLEGSLTRRIASHNPTGCDDHPS